MTRPDQISFLSVCGFFWQGEGTDFSLCIYLFSDASALHCFVQAFSSCAQSSHRGDFSCFETQGMWASVVVPGL